MFYRSVEEERKKDMIENSIILGEDIVIGGESYLSKGIFNYFSDIKDTALFKTVNLVNRLTGDDESVDNNNFKYSLIKLRRYGYSAVEPIKVTAPDNFEGNFFEIVESLTNYIEDVSGLSKYCDDLNTWINKSLYEEDYSEKMPVPILSFNNSIVFGGISVMGTIKESYCISTSCRTRGGRSGFCFCR